MPDIVVVSITSWEGDYLKSTVELSKELSARNTVWFLDYQYTLKDLVLAMLGRNKNVSWKRLLGLESRVREKTFHDGGKVMIYTPWPIIPAFWAGSYKLFAMINRINHGIVFGSFRRKLKKNRVNAKVVLTSLNPFMGLGVKKYFKGIPHVYYCFDEIRAAHYLKIFGGPAEDRLLPEVDAAVFTSDHLEKTKGAAAPKTAVVKNGVHYDAFAKHRRQAGQNKTPKVGYLGSIDDRFNIDLMEEVIKNMPGVEFHMVGRVVDKRVPGRLGKYSNVFFAPPVGADEVPPIMGSMDVGIIPYIRNEFTVAVYPLKVNEYLSVGLPVIMTSFADLPDFADVVDIADDAQTFIDLIDKNVKTDSEELILARMQFASANSWAQRAVELERVLFSFSF